MLLQGLRRRDALPVVVLLMAQVGLYIWMAPRGFEFTDEAHYFLSYLYWRDFVGVTSFFGAYFELPFRMLAQSVAAIRIFGLLLLLACGAFFTREAFGYFSRHDGNAKNTPWPLVVVGMAGSSFYFVYFSTLRAPSYNLLTLCSMLVATGMLLRVLIPGTSIATGRTAMFCYGLAVGACGLGKASAGLMLVVSHALFFALANRDWKWTRLLELLVLALAGAGLNFAVLHWAHPQWLAALREGVVMVSLDSSHGLRNALNGLRWDIQRLAPLMPWAAAFSLVFVSLVRWLGPSRRGALSALVIALIGGCVLGLIFDEQSRRWLPMLVLAVLLLWSVDALASKPPRMVRGDAADAGFMVLLVALPVVFSFGTNLPILAHSQMAAVFVVTALTLRLYRLFRLGLLAKPAFMICLCALCIPPLATQVRAAVDVHYTYRQLSALGEQTIPVRVGAGANTNTLLVDATTRATLQSVIEAARTAGLVPGQSILDFTGDGPGIVFAVGGRPLGGAWALGGYTFSHALAARVISMMSDRELQSAWLMGSLDNPRAITGWQQLLEARLGPGMHELVATVTIRSPYRWGLDSPENVTVQLWKPHAASIVRP